MSLFRRTTPGYRTQALLLGALTALAPLSIDMYLPSLPGLQQVFSASAAQVQFTLATFFAAYALGQLFWGPLSDRYGRKPPLYAALVLYIVASLACAWATSIEQLMLFRFLQALGACAGAVIARAIVRDQYDGMPAARLFAAMMLVMGVAPMVAPLIGGQLLRLADWTRIFQLLAVIGLLVLVAAHRRLRESHAPDRRVRLTWRAVLRGYARLLQDPRFRQLALVGGFVMAALYAYIAGAAFVFIEVYAVTPQTFAWLFGLNAFWFIAGTQVNSRLLGRHTSARLLSWALAGLLAGCLLLVGVTASGCGGLPLFVLVLYLSTISMGFILPNATVLVLSPFAREAGAASALYGMTQSALGALAAFALALLPDDARWAMAAVMCLCALVSAWAWFSRDARAAAHP